MSREELIALTRHRCRLRRTTILAGRRRARSAGRNRPGGRRASRVVRRGPRCVGARRTGSTTALTATRRGSVTVHAVAGGCGQVHTANFSGRPKVSLDGGVEEFPEFRPRRRSSSDPSGATARWPPRLLPPAPLRPLEQPDQREEILTRRRPQSGRHDHGSCRTHPAPVTSSGGRRPTDLLNAHTRSG
jgi:hypothetical protein